MIGRSRDLEEEAFVVVQKFVNPVAGARAGFALCFTPTAASAATISAASISAPGSISPFVALSAFGTYQSQSAVCAAGVGAAGAAAALEGQAPGQGCVLPVLDAPVAAAPVAGPPVEAAYAPVAGGGLGLGIGAILAGLIAVAGLAAVLLSSNGKGRLPISPD
jgi:hypothetical protein